MPHGSCHHEAVESSTRTYGDYLMTVTWDGSCCRVPAVPMFWWALQCYTFW